MKRLLGTVAEGTVFKMEENGAQVSFIVGKHNYQSDANGTGHTLVLRTTPLDEKQYWGGTYWGRKLESINYAEDSGLPAFLENYYRNAFDATTFNLIKPLTIRYMRSNDGRDGYRTMANQRVFVPSMGDLNSYYDDGDTISLDVRKKLVSVGYNNYCFTRSCGSHSYEDETYGVVLEAYVVTGIGATHDGEYFGTYANPYENDGTSRDYVLPCFALYDNAVIGEDGVLRGNHPPDITSLYFGMNTIHGKKNPFKLPYVVHDEDGDAITVTEKLDGTVVRTYTAEDGATNLFTVTQEMLDRIDGTTDHELTVTASDDVSSSTKKYLFHKVVGSGYVVYIGKIAGTADGTGYYWTEREVLHDAGNEEMPIVLDPELTLEKNELGSFTFTIPAINPYYDKIGLKTTVISVEEDGAEIFMGYVTEMNKQFSLDIEVTCEGELGYLQDRDCIIEEKVYSPTELVSLAVGTDTSDKQFAKEGKAFNLGEVTKQKTGTGKDDKESKSVSDCWSAVKTNLADKFGGYLRLRKIVKMENDILVYHRYLDYLDTVPDQTDQVIQFGVNLLDVSYYLKTNQLVNSVRVIGYETTGWFIFTSTNQIEETVSNNESIKKYGLCQRILTVDGTSSSRDSLRQKGLEELTKYTEQFTGSITVNAADLADIGVDVDRLEFLKNTRVISEAHGLANWMLCVKEVIPLDAPEEKEFTFGESCSSLSALQASNFGTAGKAWDMIQSTVKYVKNGG